MTVTQRRRLRLFLRPAYTWATQRAAVCSWQRRAGWRGRSLASVAGRVREEERGLSSLG